VESADIIKQSLAGLSKFVFKAKSGAPLPLELRPEFGDLEYEPRLAISVPYTVGATEFMVRAKY
jgi:hypothetical protein